MTGKEIPSHDNSEATTRKRLVAFFMIPDSRVRLQEKDQTDECQGSSHLLS